MTHPTVRWRIIPRMHPYRRLSVWRKAHELTVRAYRVVQDFSPPHWPLAAQLRRAAHSVAANIAEGSGRVTNAQFANSLQVAIASARELDYWLLLARDLDALTSNDHAMLEARTDEVTRMLVALRKTVVKRSTRAGFTRKPKEAATP